MLHIMLYIMLYITLYIMLHYAVHSVFKKLHTSAFYDVGPAIHIQTQTSAPFREPSEPLV
jgi:hypothetical protein